MVRLHLSVGQQKGNTAMQVNIQKFNEVADAAKGKTKHAELTERCFKVARHRVSVPPLNTIMREEIDQLTVLE